MKIKILFYSFFLTFIFNKQVLAYFGFLPFMPVIGNAIILILILLLTVLGVFIFPLKKLSEHIKKKYLLKKNDKKKRKKNK